MNTCSRVELLCAHRTLLCFLHYFFSPVVSVGLGAQHVNVGLVSQGDGGLAKVLLVVIRTESALIQG